MTGSAEQLEKQAPTRETAMDLVDKLEASGEAYDANNLLYAFGRSADYDPAPRLNESARCIYQDLVEQNDFRDSYQSVQRFVRKFKSTQPQRVWRMEAWPCEEVQVDFGLGAPIVEAPSMYVEPSRCVPLWACAA